MWVQIWFSLALYSPLLLKELEVRGNLLEPFQEDLVRQVLFLTPFGSAAD